MAKDKIYTPKHELAEKIKRHSSLGALRELLQLLHTESLETLKKTTSEHRFAQSRVQTLEEIINYLPESLGNHE